MKNCPTCGRVLEPATLNPKHQWCSVCAVEFDEKGKVFESKLGMPAGMEQGQAEPIPPTEPIEVALGRVHLATAQLKASGRRFRVAIDKLSFETQDTVTLDVGGTKVVITAL